MLSKEQLLRLEQEKKSLTELYQLQHEKVAKIREALVLETDASNKFKYEQQIKQEEKELKRLNDRLDKIEKQLQPKPIYPPTSKIPVNGNDTSQLKGLIHKFSPWKPLLGMVLPSVLIASGIIFYISKSFVFNYLVYENAKYGIQIKYPSNGWQIANPDDFTGEVLKLFPSNLNKLSSCPLDVFISINDVSEEKTISVDKYKNLVIKKIKNISPKPEIIDKSDSATTLSNLQAYKLVYTRQDGKCNLRVMELGTVKDGKAYFITYTAEERQYSELLPTVEKIINSFQIIESN